MICEDSMVLRAVTAMLLMCSFGSLFDANAQDQNHEALQARISQGIVEGTVLTTASTPVSDVSVEVESLQEGRVVQVISDNDGRFSFAVPEGAYVLRASLGNQMITSDLRVNAGLNPVQLTMSQEKNSDATSQPLITAQEMKVPEKAKRLLQKAEEAARKQKYDDAYRYIESALQVCPTYAHAFAIRGILERDTHPEQALLDTEAAVKNDPHYGMGYVVLGSVLTGLGRYDEAVRNLEHAIAILPASWQGYFEMSRALIGKRNYTIALQQIERASQLAPKSCSFVHLVKADILLGLHNHPAAAKELEAYLLEQPNGPKSAQVRQALDKVRVSPN